MSYIYKITNLVNNHFYIGYTSQSLSVRWSSHKWEAMHTPPEENRSHLYNAIRYYGSENFIIEPLYEFDESQENWKELEKYYIQKLDATGPNGYNILEGGNAPPVHYGDDNIKTKIKDAQIPELISMLRNTSISFREIANHFHVSTDQISRINKGECRHQDNLEYPIRKYSKQEEYALKVIELLANDITLSNAKIAELIPCYFRANEIASINNGKKYAYLWQGDFPIRKVLVPNDYEEKHNLAIEIVNFIELKRQFRKITQKELQNKFNKSRHIIEKIIKGIYPYNIDGKAYPIKLTQ